MLVVVIFGILSSAVSLSVSYYLYSKKLSRSATVQPSAPAEVKPPTESIGEASENPRWFYFPNINGIRALTFGEDNDTIWLATWSALHRYSRKEGRVIKTYTRSHGLEGNPEFLLAKNGKLYIGMVQARSPIVVLDPATDKIQGFLNDPNNPGFSREVRDFGIDGQKLWVQITTDYLKIYGMRIFDLAALKWEDEAAAGGLGKWDKDDLDFALAGNDVYFVRRLIDKGKFLGSVIQEKSKSGADRIAYIKSPDYDFRFVAAGDKYVAALADPKTKGSDQSPALFYKILPKGEWKKNKLPLGIDFGKYTKLKFDESGKAQFAFYKTKGEYEDEQVLGVYDFENQAFKQYPIPSAGASYRDVSFSGLNPVYPDSLRGETWIISGIIKTVNLSSGEVKEVFDSQKPKEFKTVVAACGGKLVVKTDLGDGIFDPQENSFKKFPSRIGDEELFGIANTGGDVFCGADIIWVRLLSVRSRDEKFKLGRYDTKNKSFEAKTIDRPFEIIGSVGSGSKNSVILHFAKLEFLESARNSNFDSDPEAVKLFNELEKIANRTDINQTKKEELASEIQKKILNLAKKGYDLAKSESKIALFDFGKGTYEILLDIKPTHPVFFVSASGLSLPYSEKYGVLLLAEGDAAAKGYIWSFDPVSKKFKQFLKLPFEAAVIKTNGDKLFVLSGGKENSIFRLNKNDQTLSKIIDITGDNSFSKPFEIFGGRIAVKRTSQKLYGPSEVRSKDGIVELYDFNGKLFKTLGAADGMVSESFESYNMKSDSSDHCLWFFTIEAMWGYCS